MRALSFCLIPALLAMASLPVSGQALLNAKSGMVNYVEGEATLGGQTLELKAGQFPEVKEGVAVATALGRVEVALTPGVMLRLGENSSFRMVTNRLVDTRLELLTGSAVVEATEIAKGTRVTLVVGAAEAALVKSGIYRFDAAPARLRVFDGAADVLAAGEAFTVKGGRTVSLGGALALAEKFDEDSTDSLDRWSRRRADLVAIANVSAANRGRYYNGYANCQSLYGSWMMNPYYQMLTYVPCGGVRHSPYGYAYYSPGAVYQTFYARPIYVAPVGGGAESRSYPSMAGGGGAAISAPSAQTSGRATMGAPSAASSGGSSAAPAARAGGGRGN